ncbi:hypothetical protein A3A76_00785 [Candidatus Woesebacteria bacterium RIFCSPLOWO2_01_FULL_39_23]|uniref:Uncharacterized protein n=1 Tax=Candidatus Woesebacteria bacterium RIFCSPHIGHO2_01_FULL_40_22 TaxID=1802499 RepID=A0A1F7YIR3_9BACT|nr:MAG: hypothetical protein A2628_04460 [Candidatus Woesebacteria bacterium RIFCSPHIGHO2_01_FULL_40_22]OGM35758.1 MAG: hypothetical protein A3E41_03835 [Candidatus Woesebacteria bacterium RIFCSPHIGHO2_12_FULL_38_9]OGM63075.1 MAG: hypothetical protein A3A76_00785 [Candidatus Woesebacteria bacterium RIFCSPLOWO2_01_FULL_39_23]
MADVERGVTSKEELVTERPTEIPPEVEQGLGVKTRRDDFTAQVTDDSGKPLIRTPKTQQVTIQIPASQTQLTAWTKGSADDALTWFAVFWIRLIQKAVHFGWRMIKSGGSMND